MPELPEVETIRRQLEPQLVDAHIVDAWAFDSDKFTDASLAVGTRIAGLRRRGKYLLIDLARSGTDGHDVRHEELIVHLGMTGRLAVGDAPGEPRPPHLRASWSFDDGRTFRFDDVRRFGRIAVVDRGDHQRLPTLRALGPEPFDAEFTPESLRAAINASTRAVKTQLLDQRVVAGVGNIYADESLWRAAVHPRSRRLTRAQAVRLHAAIVEAIESGIDNGGTTLRNYRDALGEEGSNQRQLRCYGRGGEPCLNCGSELRRVVVDARGTTFCPTCQKQ